MAPEPSRHALGSLLAHRQHNTEAGAAGLCFWARSIGERNPRYVDQAFRSPYGMARFVAHPCWPYSVQDTLLSVPGQALLPIIAGCDWTFVREVVAGDRLHTRARVLSERATNGRHAGMTIVQEVEVRYSDERGALVAVAVSTLFQVDPARARASTKHAAWQRRKYTAAELARIESDYDAEVICSAAVRHFEDVAVGDELPRIVRGPVTSEEMVLFVGATNPIPSGAAFALERAQGRARGFLHPSSGVIETYAAGFVDDISARELGFPAAHDYGIDRISQAASLVTNWMGDGARLTRLTARLRAPAMLGDATWFDARVAALLPTTADSGIAQLELTAANQRGETTLTGSAAVELPRRLRIG